MKKLKCIFAFFMCIVMAFSWFQVAPLANATEFLEKISVPGENSFEIKNLRVLNENLDFIDSLAGCAEVMVCFEIINNMSADYEAVVDICLLDGNTTISHTYVTTYIKKNSNTEFAKKKFVFREITLKYKLAWLILRQIHNNILLYIHFQIKKIQT